MANKLTDEIRKAIKSQLTARPKQQVYPNRHRRNSAGLWVRPFHSDALGVNPDQIPEATKVLRDHGCMADFAPDGSLIITSDEQFRQAAKARGLWDGRHGFGPKDQEGNPVKTGRELEQAKEAFRRAVANGDFD